MPPRGNIMTEEGDPYEEAGVELSDYLEEYLKDMTGRTPEEFMIRKTPYGDEGMANETVEVTFEMTYCEHMVIFPMLKELVDGQSDIQELPKTVVLRRFFNRFSDATEGIQDEIEEWFGGGAYEGELIDGEDGN